MSSRYQYYVHTFSTVMTRPSNTELSRYLMQRSASLTVAMVTKPNPQDSLVQGSSTTFTSITYNTNSKIKQ
jgi:hypothetical protein